MEGPLTELRGSQKELGEPLTELGGSKREFGGPQRKLGCPHRKLGGPHKVPDVDINTENSLDNSGSDETMQKVLASIVYLWRIFQKNVGGSKFFKI